MIGVIPGAVAKRRRTRNPVAASGCWIAASRPSAVRDKGHVDRAGSEDNHHAQAHVHCLHDRRLFWSLEVPRSAFLARLLLRVGPVHR